MRIRLRLPGRRRVRLPIAAILVGGFGTLMLLAVASVLALGLTSATQNTYTLLGDKASLILANVEVRVRHQLDPAANAARFLAGLVERGELDPTDQQRLLDTVRGTLAGIPDVTGVGFVRADLTGTRATRVDGSLRTETLDLRTIKDLQPEWRNGADRVTPVWLDPIWSKEFGTSLLILLQPVRRDGRYLGQVAIGVSLHDLSRFLSAYYVEQGINAFVLYDNEHVLAHSTLGARKFDFSGRSNGPPLPRIDQMDDPALAALWSKGRTFEVAAHRIEGRVVAVGGEEHLMLLRRMSGYGQQDWLVGVTFRESEVNQELKRLDITAATGIGILLISVGAALFVGRRISRQIARLSDAADRIRAFEFRDVPDIPDSRVRELARAATAFNSMVAGLRWFETYVPKALVLRLMHRSGQTMTLLSEERPVTVMFTDIRGFSALAEHMGAAETAALLNAHFTLLADCIEAEGGTVDKFIGDAIMAFWGAPDEQADHAARALRAGRAIARAVAADNRRRAGTGLPPIRVRIGMHSGMAVVGNIGSNSRINYTMVGDTVNVAARVEELASRIQGDDEVIVLASGTTAQSAGDAVPMTCIGHRALRGRNGTCEIWRVVTNEAGLSPGLPML